MNNNNLQDNRTIRRQMRNKRVALSDSERQVAALAASRHARFCPQLLKAKRLLSYSPVSGELSPRPTARLSGAQQYLPRIVHYQQCKMHFYRVGISWQRNRYGIPEPATVGAPIAANELDIILVPLLAFDRLGNRIGMGAGYYDRALQSLSHQPSTRPFLLGMGYHFQEINPISPNPWDVPLDAILTDREFIRL